MPALKPGDTVILDKWMQSALMSGGEMALPAGHLTDIAEALREAATPAPSSPGVPDSVREAIRLLDEAEKRKTDLKTPEGILTALVIDARDKAEALALEYVRALISAHPAGQSAGQGADARKRDGGQRIIEGLNDALAHAQGDTSRARILRIESAAVVDSKPAPDSTRAGPVGAEGEAVEAIKLATNSAFNAGVASACVDFPRRCEANDRATARRDEAIAAVKALAARPAAPETQGAERVRHVKRGTEYEVVGEAEAQVATQDYQSAKVCGEGRRILREGQTLTVYRGSDGKLWCRFTDEFRDGRFEPTPPASSDQESA
ncbi:hypothetical protein OFEAOIEE_LOCUS4974 [Methylorubrum extorquens]